MLNFTETLAMIDKLMQFEMGVVDKVVTLTQPASVPLVARRQDKGGRARKS